MDRKTPLIVITGPTCSGKTGVALQLARDYPIEVVSADSMQVYRHMDIATAKPSPAELARLPHHLIDVVDPDEEFNAGMFSTRASRVIEEVRSRGKVPVIVGGTGLYIKALVYGLSPAPRGSARLRSCLKSMADKAGSPSLWRMLDRLDRETAKITNENDRVRIIRALEIAFLTGVKPSVIHRGHGFSKPLYEARLVCIMPQRERLYADIDERVIRMVDSGLIEETEKLFAMGYDPDLRSMQTLAYRHVLEFLASRIDLERAISLIQRDTRRYAKRQMTWMRSHHDPGSFCSAGDALKTVSGWLDEGLPSH
ncbi:MAG TPA: tRNA (adenosine(37)-N6)-dimethylallyltransferase MiaA [Deltaproteobacteria bacterium]|nr:tRNA (adenosine(37)-N6)-dimethylallyltransferase MiaA [Deltaproteobacteria bacterium]